MSSLWDGSAGDWVAADPDRETLALSVAAKVMTIVAIVALIVALWAMTSPQARSQTDATLGPPMGASTQLRNGEPGTALTTVDTR